MEFLEKNLEDIIFETKNEHLEERGLNISGKKLRQIKIGNYGIADIITWEKYPNVVFDGGLLKITIYELKQNKVNASSFFQGIRYCRGVQSYLDKRKIEIPIKINLVLIGREIDKSSDFCYLTNLIDSDDYSCGEAIGFNIYTYRYDFFGIKFEHHYNYVLKDEGFNL